MPKLTLIYHIYVDITLFITLIIKIRLFIGVTAIIYSVWIAKVYIRRELVTEDVVVLSREFGCWLLTDLCICFGLLPIRFDVFSVIFSVLDYGVVLSLVHGHKLWIVEYLVQRVRGEFNVIRT